MRLVGEVATSPLRSEPWWRERWLIGALVVGLALRVAWVLAATPSGFEVWSDPYEYLSYADSLARFSEYRINGQVTAMFPNGWPLALAPIAFVSNHTGWFSQVAGAGFLTIVFSTFAVFATFRLAEIWFGRRVGLLACWFVALSPALIGIAATPLTESPFIAVMLGLLILLSRVLRSEPLAIPSSKAIVGFGVLGAYLVMIRSQGLILLPIAAVLLWLRARSRAPVVHAAKWVLVGTLLVFVPMTLRNGMQIGFWSPMSTGNQAGGMCMAHHDGATSWWVDDPKLFAECFWGAPHAGNNREAEWAREAPIEAVGYALTHPREEWRLAVHKTWLEFGQERVGGAVEFTAYLRAVPDRFFPPIYRSMEAWRLAAMILTVVALVRYRRCREAYVLWVVPLLLVLTSYAGAAAARVFVVLVPFLAIYSAVAVVGAVEGDRPSLGPLVKRPFSQWSAWTQRARLVGVESTEPADQRRRSRVAGPPGRPLHPMIAAMAIGAWVAALGFDAVSWVSDTEWVYARGAWLLTGLGLGAGLVAALLGLIDLLAVPRETAAFRTGVRHLAAADVAIVFFAISFAVRNQSDFAFHDSATPLAIALSVVGLASLSVGVWLGTALTYEHGVRVETDDDDDRSPTRQP